MTLHGWSAGLPSPCLPLGPEDLWVPKAAGNTQEQPLPGRKRGRTDEPGGVGPGVLCPSSHAPARTRLSAHQMSPSRHGGRRKWPPSGVPEATLLGRRAGGVVRLDGLWKRSFFLGPWVLKAGTTLNPSPLTCFMPQEAVCRRPAWLRGPPMTSGSSVCTCARVGLLSGFKPEAWPPGSGLTPLPLPPVWVSPTPWSPGGLEQFGPAQKSAVTVTVDRPRFVSTCACAQPLPSPALRGRLGKFQKHGEHSLPPLPQGRFKVEFKFIATVYCQRAASNSSGNALLHLQ